jgi:hypothetical protein
MKCAVPTWLFLVATPLAGAVGCSSAVQPREDETTMDLRHIARAYGVIQSAHNRPPKDVDEIKAILTDLHAGQLSGPPDEVLTSARDGQPYVIVLTVNLGSAPGNDIFIYEQVGKDGSRYVMTTALEVRQVPDAEFAQASFAKGHRPGG